MDVGQNALLQHCRLRRYERAIFADVNLYFEKVSSYSAFFENDKNRTEDVTLISSFDVAFSSLVISK